MKALKYIYKSTLAVCMGLAGFLATSCNDTMEEENFFVFKGEMMNQYLENRPEQFSKFTQIISRTKYSTRKVNIMDLISVYGQFTCFAPTNEAVDQYLEEHKDVYPDFESLLEDVDVCDTIARTHLINGMAYNTIDFAGLSEVQRRNMNDRNLSLEEYFVTGENEDTIATTYRLNGSVIYHKACNDTVANGIVHTIDRVMVSSTKRISDLLSENPKVSLFSQALQATGLGYIMAEKTKDETWDYFDPKYEKYHKKDIYSGAQHDMSDIPEKREFKFTIFACPDSILKEKYNITDLKSFYNYAQSIYGGPDYDEDNKEALRDLNSPLRRLIGYNCLPFATTYDKYTVITSWRYNINDACINPHEWFTTMDSLATIKIMRVLSPKDLREHPEAIRNDLYLNRGDMIRCDSLGVHVCRPDGEYEQDALNGKYFLTDGLADFGEGTKTNIFNTRIRFDMMCLFPEFYNNDLRNETPWDLTASTDINAPAKNWILPNGYLDGVKVNEDGIFLYQGARSWYWSYEGDEFNLCSDVNKYDVEFYLPTVPSGTYQIRLGFCAMDTRGICQFYLDGKPQGIPFDQRSTNGFSDRIGWTSLSDMKRWGDADRMQAAKKNMHNNGWYHGPASVFTTPYGVKDGSAALAAIGEGNWFANQSGTVRYVMATANLDENKRHKIRIKSIWAVGTALVMMDYFEMVPKSVYGVDNSDKAEDDY